MKGNLVKRSVNAEIVEQVRGVCTVYSPKKPVRRASLQLYIPKYTFSKVLRTCIYASDLSTKIFKFLFLMQLI